MRLSHSVGASFLYARPSARSDATFANSGLPFAISAAAAFFASGVSAARNFATCARSESSSARAEDAREKAEKEVPGFWLAARQPGRVLDACARDLPPDAVTALFDQAGSDRPRLEALVANLASRVELPNLLVARKVVGVLAEKPSKAL